MGTAVFDKEWFILLEAWNNNPLLNRRGLQAPTFNNIMEEMREGVHHTGLVWLCSGLFLQPSVARYDG